MAGDITFAQKTVDTFKKVIATDPVGNRVFKVNLHVHGESSAAADLVAAARRAEIDLIAITDHQSFRYYGPIATAVSTPGRPLAVLPGIEITSVEGAHVLGLFDQTFDPDRRTRFEGWLEVSGSGDTNIASRRKMSEVLIKIDEEGGVAIVPHPFSPKIGLLDSARKISTKKEWLDSGHVALIQTSPDKVKFIDRDDRGDWVNRYVLASATEDHIKASSYCLAPFGRTDVHKPDEMAEGCSWFRMAEPTVQGLKQVACEPRTRILRDLPQATARSKILGIRVSGGYCDGQVFRFSEHMNCIVGPNYAGKSAVFDFVRFALAHETRVDEESKDRLLSRIQGILTSDGQVELYLFQNGRYYVVIRELKGPDPVLAFFDETTSEVSVNTPLVYEFDSSTDELVPVDDFEFPLEVYEQGRIHRLRDDMGHLLEMLDGFADLAVFKRKRSDVIQGLCQSADRLAPRYEERERLKSEVGNLDQLKTELADKVKLLPGDEETRWATTGAVIRDVETAVQNLREVAARLENAREEEYAHDDLVRLFRQAAPAYSAESVVHEEILSRWTKALTATLGEVAGARQRIVEAIKTLESQSSTLRVQWQKEREAHDRAVGERLAQAGVTSPKEVIRRVELLRSQIQTLENTKQPRLVEVEKQILQEESKRGTLLEELENLDRDLTSRREEKAKELTSALDNQIKISVSPSADRAAYAEVLNELCNAITTRERKIQGREGQLERIVRNMSPLRLAKALVARGEALLENGSRSTLCDACGVTENTQSVLCRIADNVKLLNRLQTTEAPDTLEIQVRRHGETTYADLRTGLSPGEQSAALLTLALQTRAMPLMLDQPEDELGYSFVVHLIVPKLLQAKFSRQLLVITHNANVPVLGDADYVIRMENRPRGEASRECVVACEGTFEVSAVTAALMDLEGGPQAFKFRQHRYSLAPRA